MDDRKLLELAAKAAGMHKLTEWSDGIWDHDSPHYGYPALHEAGPGGACGSWNPLTDDGDALRLAFALGMSVDAGACMIDYAVPDADDEELETLETLEFEHGGDIANLRRAIVRAAAEIGRAM